MTTPNPIDPAEVRLTGENSFIRLLDGNENQTARASHWRVLFSPAGPGHVLFLKSDLAESVSIYADNIALARWLQEEIESQLFQDFADPSVPVVDAEFSKKGDTTSFWTETVENDEDNISLTWYDFLEPYMLVSPAGGNRTHGVYSCFTPAKAARLTVNGDEASGNVGQEMRGDKQSSTACLAWSETWVRP